MSAKVAIFPSPRLKRARGMPKKIPWMKLAFYRGWSSPRVLLATVVALLLTAAPAFADPCEGALPSRAGERFSGQVRYVGDGDGLCVGASGDAAEWIEVRLADFNAPELNGPGGREAREVLQRVAMGRRAECVATPGRSRRVRSYDRVIAVCRIDGRSIGEIMRAANVAEGGN